MPKGVPEPGGHLTSAEKMRRHRLKKRLEARAADLQLSAVVHDPMVDSPELWQPQALEIARVTLQYNEHLRDRRYADQVMAYAHFEARLRARRATVAGLDLETARTEVTIFDETTEGLPSSGLVRKIAQARKVLSHEAVLDEMERTAMAMRKDLGITPSGWARIRDAMERKKGVDLAKEWSVIEGEAG